MKYNKLGTTDEEVSVICLGTMTWGEQNTEDEGHEQMSYALDQGVNFFDTAELYPVPSRAGTLSRTEEIIGTWFEKTGNRDKVFLATKIAGPGPYTAHIREASEYSSQNIIDAVDGSLKRLQTDMIDLYQIHWPARATNFFGKRGYYHSEGWSENFGMILETLQEIIKSGKVRHIGISNETPWGFMTYLKHSAAKGLPRVMTVQNPYSLLNRTYEVGMAEMSIREKAGLLAYSPMAFGRLSGKYLEGKDNPASRLNKFDRMSRYNSENSIKATQKYYDIAQENGWSLAQMSLAWVNQQKFVTSNIIGATSIEQLKENISSIDIEIPKEVVKKINAVQEIYPDPAP